MKPLLLGFAVFAACGSEPPEPAPELEVDIPARGSGVFGLPIKFSVAEADGTVVGAGNSTGEPFLVPIQPGARLTVDEDHSFSPSAQFHTRFTITDLQPGDHVLHGTRVEPSRRVGDVTLRFVGVPNLPVGSSYYFVTPCELEASGEGLAILSFRQDCVPASAFTIHGYVVDSTGPRLHTEIAVPEFQAYSTIDATEVWSPVPTRSVTVRGLPPDASGVLVRLGVSFEQYADRIVTPAAGDVVVDLPVMAGPRHVVTLAVVTTRPGALGVQRHLFGVDDAAPAVTLDLGPHPLPWITGSRVADDAGVAWTQDGAGAPDFVRVTDSVGNVHLRYAYEVLGPPGRRLDGGSVQGTLSLVDCPDADGYQQVKQDHKRVCSTIGLGQVLVESVSPATLTSRF